LFAPEAVHINAILRSALHTSSWLLSKSSKKSKGSRKSEEAEPPAASPSGGASESTSQEDATKSSAGATTEPPAAEETQPPEEITNLDSFVAKKKESAIVNWFLKWDRKWGNVTDEISEAFHAFRKILFKLPLFGRFIGTTRPSKRELRERFGDANVLLNVTTGRSSRPGYVGFGGTLAIIAIVGAIAYLIYKFIIEPMFNASEMDVVTTVINDCFEALSSNDKVMAKLGGTMSTDDNLMTFHRNARIGELRIVMPIFGTPPMMGRVIFIVARYKNHGSAQILIGVLIALRVLILSRVGEAIYKIVKARAEFVDGEIFPIPVSDKRVSVKSVTAELARQAEEEEKEGKKSGSSGNKGLFGRLGARAQTNTQPQPE
jgi:hypothetical protein